MPLKKKSTALSIADSINVIAALIGIFGFLTGISSLPILLSNKNGVQTDATWFFGDIPYSISIPVFILTLVFVYGLYFVIIFKANRWFFAHGIIKRYAPPGLSRRDMPNYDLVYGGRPGDEITILGFVCLGSAIGWLITRAFFGVSLESLFVIFEPSSPLYKDSTTQWIAMLTLLAIMLIVGLVWWLCSVAKDSVSIE